MHDAACCFLLLPAAACCCLLLPAAAYCCLLLSAAAHSGATVTSSMLHHLASLTKHMYNIVDTGITKYVGHVLEPASSKQAWQRVNSKSYFKFPKRCAGTPFF